MLSDIVKEVQTSDKRKSGAKFRNADPFEEEVPMTETRNYGAKSRNAELYHFVSAPIGKL